eukprot:gene22628-29771_t
MTSENKRSGGPPPGGHAHKKPANEDEDLIDSFLNDEDADPDNLMMDEMIEEVDLGEAGRNWVRPPVPEFDPAKDNIVFQQLELDYKFGEPIVGLDLNKESFKENHQVPIIHMYGVNDTGNSVCVFVHGFEPYFYIEKPGHWSTEDCDSLVKELNQRLVEKTRGQSPAVVRVEVENRASVWNYQWDKKKDFLKIACLRAVPNPKPQTLIVSTGLFESGLFENGLSLGAGHLPPCTTYESGVLFALRFMIDCKIVGGNWIELPAGKYKVPSNPMTYCQIEGHFPDAKMDPVIQIASMGESSPIVKNVMTLGTCASIVGSEVMSFERSA